MSDRTPNHPWFLRVQVDADDIFRHMVARYEGNRGPMPFSVAEIVKETMKSRDRVVGALVFLVGEQRIGVGGRTAETAYFYPPNNALMREEL